MVYVGVILNTLKVLTTVEELVQTGHYFTRDADAALGKG